MGIEASLNNEDSYINYSWMEKQEFCDTERFAVYDEADSALRDLGSI